MDLEEEYREHIALYKNNPDGLKLIVDIMTVRRQKLLLAVENSDDKDKLWDLKTKLSFLTEFQREIITHSKD